MDSNSVELGLGGMNDMENLIPIEHISTSVNTKKKKDFVWFIYYIENHKIHIRDTFECHKHYY